MRNNLIQHYKLGSWNKITKKIQICGGLGVAKESEVTEQLNNNDEKTTTRRKKIQLGLIKRETFLLQLMDTTNIYVHMDQLLLKRTWRTSWTHDRMKTSPSHGQEAEKALSPNTTPCVARHKRGIWPGQTLQKTERLSPPNGHLNPLESRSGETSPTKSLAYKANRADVLGSRSAKET